MRLRITNQARITVSIAPTIGRAATAMLPPSRSDFSTLSDDDVGLSAPTGCNQKSLVEVVLLLPDRLVHSYWPSVPLMSQRSTGVDDPSDPARSGGNQSGSGSVPIAVKSVQRAGAAHWLPFPPHWLIAVVDRATSSTRKRTAHWTLFKSSHQHYQSQRRRPKTKTKARK